MKLTLEILNKNHACKEGIKYFKRKYPKGLLLTKKNIRKAVQDLFRLKYTFYSFGRVAAENPFDVKNQIDFCLSCLSKNWKQSTDWLFDHEGATVDEITEIIWKEINVSSKS